MPRRRGGGKGTHTHGRRRGGGRGEIGGGGGGKMGGDFGEMCFG